jgi:hypothetical protein
VYAWPDENGVANFGDDPQASSKGAPLSVSNNPPEFTVSLTAFDVTVPQALEGKINAGAKRIYDYWSAWLGPSRIVRSHVDILIEGDRKRFIDRWSGDPKGTIPSGFFSQADNQVVIFYPPSLMSAERLEAIAFHEISHLISMQQVGPLPPWYGEGLAEYFETMDVRWQSASFQSQLHWQARARQVGLLPLHHMLALGHDEWFTGDISRRYLTAGALVAFLQSAGAGREVLAKLARTAHANRCNYEDRKSALSLQSYPGGQRSLQAALARWLQSA